MANAQSLLNAAKKQKENGGTTAQPSQKQQTRIGKQMMESAMAVSGDVSSLENLYFNPNEEEFSLDEAYEVYPNGQKRKIYDAEEDMKEMSSFKITNVESKMPKAILESLMSDPLNMPTDGVVYSGNDVNNMMDGLQNRTIDILEKLDARDRQGKPKQQTQQEPVRHQQPINETVDYNFGGEIDYKKIAQIVEAVVDKKMKQYSQALLTESRNAGQNGNKVSFLKLGDTFTFMDDANNVYECKMFYKGKGKVKKN